MIHYCYDTLGFYTGPNVPRLDPANPFVNGKPNYLTPGRSTDIEPPRNGLINVFLGGRWEGFHGMDTALAVVAKRLLSERDEITKDRDTLEKMHREAVDKCNSMCAELSAARKALGAVAALPKWRRSKGYYTDRSNEHIPDRLDEHADRLKDAWLEAYKARKEQS